MALNKQEVIIEFNAETNEAERSVNSLTESYSDLEKKIDAVSDAQQRQASLSKNQGKAISDITKAVDKVTKAEGDRAKVEKTAITSRSTGNKKYGDGLKGILSNLSAVTRGQTNFLQKGIQGFSTIKGALTGITGGFKLMKTAIASTGIGLVVVAATELFSLASSIIERLSDDGAVKNMEAIAAESKEITAEAERQVQILEAQGAKQSEIRKAKKEALDAALEQAEAELALAEEQGEQEQILAAQNRLKQANLDITLQELEADKERRDVLEELRRQADDEYREQAEDREATEDFEAKLLETTEKRLEVERQLGMLTSEVLNFQTGETKTIDNLYDELDRLMFNTEDWVQEYRQKVLQQILDRSVLQEEINELLLEEAEYQEIIRLTEEQRSKEKEEDAKRDNTNSNSRRDRMEGDAQRERELRYQLQDELYKLTLDARDQEELAAQQLYDKRIAIAGDDEGLIKAATEQLQRDLQQIDFKYEELRQQAMLEGEDEDLDPRLVMLEKYYAAAQTLLQQDLQYTRDEELASIQERYATQLALAEQLGMDKEVLLEAQRKEELAINEHYDALEEQREQDKFQMRLQFAVQGVQAIAALGKAFASQDEADAERSFKVQKGLSIASATVSAIEGVINAYKTAQSSPFTLINPAYPYIQAGLAAAFGTAQVATIARQQYSPSGTPDDIDPGPGAGGGQGLAAPTIDLSFLGEGAGQADPIRAYVLSENVSNAQQANQKILDQAALRN